MHAAPQTLTQPYAHLHTHCPGWSAHAVAKIIDTGMYEVVIVSPRNFFLFTPMLSGSAVGTVEFRSISEPIRQANPIAGERESMGLCM